MSETKLDECVSNGAQQSVGDTPEPKRRGRPPKAVVAANKGGSRAVRGRPPGEASAMAEFRARLITSPKSKKVIEKIFDAALDDEHKGQTAAWKLIVDRLAPLSTFEKGSGGKAAVTINISGMGVSANTNDVSEQDDVIDGELEDDN